MAKTAAKWKAGQRFQTNDKFAELFAGDVQTWRGALLRPHVSISGAWHVRVDGVVAPQVLHHRYLERET